MDAAGNVHVVDNESDTDPGNSRVVELPAGSNTQKVMALTGLGEPTGVAVDAAGTVYVADDGKGARRPRVLKLAAGSNAPTVLPFTGLNGANGVAVDTASAVYVTDNQGNKVLKLAAG